MLLTATASETSPPPSWQTQMQTYANEPHQIEFTLTITRDDGDYWLGQSEFRLDDLPIVERLTRGGMSAIEEIHRDFP